MNKYQTIRYQEVINFIVKLCSWVENMPSDRRLINMCKYFRWIYVLQTLLIFTRIVQRHLLRVSNISYQIFRSKQTNLKTSVLWYQVIKCHHRVATPLQQTLSWMYCIEGPSDICRQSAEVRLAVSAGQPLFTLRLLIFALSFVDFLSLLWSPSANIEIFFLSKVSFEGHTQNLQKIMLV